MNKTKKSYSKKFIVFIIIVSLFWGSLAGAFFGFIGGVLGPNLLSPYISKTSWGQAIIDQGTKNITLQIEEESETIEVVEKVSPSVVSIVISKELDNFYNISGPFNFFDNFFPFFQQRLPQPENDEPIIQKVGGGTGFIISEDGLILTNKHVVDDEDAEYTVILNDGTEYEATVLGRDFINDIAVIKIEAENLPVVELGDSDDIKTGQTVIAIGNALAEFSNTVTKGVISGINREITAGTSSGQSEEIREAIQTDAAINPGNSGGPLLNLKGQVIGINTAMSQGGQLVGFAIPVNTAKQIIESVKEHGRIVRPWLGVRYIPITEQIAKENNLDFDYGVLILRGQTPTELAVVPGSPADKADLIENDIILEVNGQKLDEDHQLTSEISKYSPGEEIELKIYHKGEEKKVKVKLEERK